MRHPGIQVICLGLLMLGIVVLPTWLQRQPPAELLGSATSDCALGAPCHTELPGLGAVQLSIQPPTLPHDQPLEVSVQAPAAVREASVQFIGKEMYMGLQPVPLIPDDTNHYRTSTRISYCTVDSAMRWQAEVRLHTNAGVYQITFSLEPTT
ncbi:hypothetical protein [Aestuariirhabdus sp. LZHN29]|uniref:hypothetical protein n=1 Tax=Aestuariirhabdus sp. LZHN29 TaxID=3417462 RepID=UPI003CE988E7